MKRTTVFLDERLLKQLRGEARKQGVSFAAVVREALATYVAAPQGRNSIPGIAGRFSSGRDDTSEHVDELLWRDPHA